MYRVSKWHKYKRDITKEIIVGFQEYFIVNKETKNIDWKDFSTVDMAYYLFGMEGDAGETFNPKDEFIYINKIKTMYNELLDSDNEYTFDEFGEYLLYRIIEVTNHELGQAIDESYFKQIGWISSFSFYSMMQLGNDLIQKAKGLDMEFDKKRTSEQIAFDIQEEFQAITQFPFMNNREFSPLFSNFDFLQFKKMELDLDTKIDFMNIHAKYLETISESDNRQPWSGSLKYPCVTE